MTSERAVVGTTGVRAMLAAFKTLGLDPVRLTAHAALNERDLVDPDRVIPAPAFYRLWEIAQREWGRPALGIQTARHVPFGAYEVIDYLMVSSPTVGAGVAALAEYMAMVTRTARYELHERPEQISCEMVWRIPARGIMFHLRDYSLALVAGRVAHVAGQRPLRVELNGPPLATAREYTAAFGVTTILRAPRNALVFSRAAWEARLPHRDEMLNRTLRRHAQLLLDRQPAGERDTVTEQVRASLLRASPARPASIEEVAGRLALSPRTLQRRLRNEGATFDAVSRHVRATLAEAYLGDRGVSIGEIAYLLGFSEPSAFSRAFRRWTGRSPQAYRGGMAENANDVSAPALRNR